MRIAAHVRNAGRSHEVSVSTDGNSQVLTVPAKSDGAGSAVNGGEFLMLALATCYCNDIFREAKRLGIQVDEVEAEAWADFEGRGFTATNIQYSARVKSPARAEEIAALLRETDAIAEIHNTVRKGVGVTLKPWRESES